MEQNQNKTNFQSVCNAIGKGLCVCLAGIFTVVAGACGVNAIKTSNMRRKMSQEAANNVIESLKKQRAALDLIAADMQKDSNNDAQQ